MAISISVYSNVNTATKTISFDFFGDALAPNDKSSAIPLTTFYIKATPGARLDDNTAAPIRIIRKMDDLALMGNGVGTGMSHSISINNSPYATIKEMITDYVYDYIHGHTGNQFGTGCSAQRPIKFR